MSSRDAPLTRPFLSLFLIFSAWKTLLFIVAVLTPGLGYDTSTDLLFHHDDAQLGAGLSANDWKSRILGHILNRLVRWDAIYFASVAHRGYRHEQEWAFGWGFTSLISFVTKSLYGSNADLWAHASAGVLLATASHLASVLLLHQLVLLFFPRHSDTSARIAFTASLLHIIAPAGLFLCAPYGESLFALLNFSGMLAYRRGTPSRCSPFKTRTLQHDLWLLAAGGAFGLAVTIRSNGLLNGAVFALDLAALMLDLPHVLRSYVAVRHAAALGLGGAFVGLGFIVPQYIAYVQFCTAPDADVTRRSWCSAIPPSIYTFVQQRYWNVGFLHYWKPQHIPEFLLAAPMLVLMITSALSTLTRRAHAASDTPLPMSTEDSTTPTPPPDPLSPLLSTPLHKHAATPPIPAGSEEADSTPFTTPLPGLWRLALPQLLLALPALTHYHVQIITRLASGYPALYVWVARAAVEGRTLRLLGRELALGRLVVSFFVMYAIVQGALFASFLPPA